MTAVYPGRRGGPPAPVFPLLMLTSYLLILLAALLLLAACLLAQARALPWGNVGSGTLSANVPGGATTAVGVAFASAAAGRVLASRAHYGDNGAMSGPPTGRPGRHGRVPGARGQPGAGPSGEAGPRR